MRPPAPVRLILFALAALFLVAAKPVPADPREARVREITLGNGLKVLLLENHTAPIVSVWAWYRVGSQHDRAGATGLAHLVEHLTYEGNDEIPKSEITGRVERQGGAWNGYTWLDETAFYETAPASALDSLLAIESQRMGRASFPEKAMEPVRNAVLGELEAGNASPAETLDQEIVSAAFKSHPYRTPTIGWRSDVAAIAREDALGFYYEWYVPSAATIVVVGDFRTQDAAKLVHARFDALPQGSAPGDAGVVEPPQEGERRVSLSRATAARHFEAGYRAPAATDPDFAAFLVADAILAGAKGTNLWTLSEAPAPRGSRLYRAVLARGLATSARTAYLPTRASYLDAIRVVAADGADAARIEEAVLAAAESMAGDVTAGEVDHAKRDLAAKLVFESASDTDLAHQLGFFQTLDPTGPGWRRAWRLPAEVARVTADDVKRVAAKYFVPGGRTVGWLNPPAAPAPAKPESKAVKGSTPKTYRALSAAEGAPAATPPATPSMSPASRRKPIPAFGPAPVRQVLPNGLVILAVRNPLASEIEIRVDVLAGGERDPAEKSGAAELCARLLPSGGGAHGELQVADAFAAAAATVDASVDEERATLRSRMLAGNFDALLPILREMVVSPSFPKDSFDREKKGAAADARERERDPEAVAERSLRATLYPVGDPRVRDPRGTPASLEALSRVDLAEFHRRYYRPDSTVIAISGDLDPQTAIRAVKKIFGTWKVLGPAPAKLVFSTAGDVAPGTGLARVPVESASATLVVGGAGVARGDKDWPAVAAARLTLEARLSKALREDASLASWVAADVDAGMNPGPFLLRAGVAPGGADAALSAMRETMSAMAKDGTTDAELALAKSRLLGRLARDLETNRDLAATLVDAERYGDGADGAKAAAARVQALTIDDVNRCSRTWLPTTGPAVLAGPKK